MAGNTDALVELPISEYSSLKQFLKSRWPTSIYAYYLLKYQERWTKDGCHNIKVYLPYGNSGNGIVFISILTDLMYGVTIYTVNSNTQLLSEALINTKMIDWSRPEGVMMSCLHNSVESCIRDIYNKLNIKVMRQYLSLCVYKKLDQMMNETYKCPDDLYIAQLRKQNAPQMNETWSHKFPGSEKYLVTLIEMNGGYGLFTKLEGELIAWITQTEYGALGHLYCVEHHRKKAYGELMIRVIEKELSEKDEHVHAFILEDNHTSKKFFQKMGYDVNAEVYWMKGVKTNLEKVAE